MPKAIKRKTNKKRKMSKRKTRGGCGCNSGLIAGGGDFFLSGPPASESLNGLPLHSFYPENKFLQDPQGDQLSSRLIGGGGKKKKGKKSKPKTKKRGVKKGGNFSDYTATSLDSVPNNPISFFGTTSGSAYSNDIVNGSSNDNNIGGVRSHFAGSTLV